MVRKGKGPWQRNVIIMKLQCIFFLYNLFMEEKMKTKEAKRMVKLDFFFQNCPFWSFKENQHIHFLVHGHI